MKEGEGLMATATSHPAKGWLIEVGFLNWSKEFYQSSMVDPAKALQNAMVRSAAVGGIHRGQFIGRIVLQPIEYERVD
jgi:hypothetical protein